MEQVLHRQQQHIGAIELAPEALGEFCQGLIQVLASQFVFDDELVQGLAFAINQWDETTFLAALPSLRLAFTQLAPKQGRQLYQRLFAQPMPYSQPQIDVQQLQEMAKLEDRVLQNMRLWGLSHE